MTARPEPPSWGAFPRHASDKLRYRDTDRQGHVNNAAFSTFLETGRVELIYDPALPLTKAGTSFVLARLELDLIWEATWPGIVGIGTGVEAVGTSSVTLVQGLFQEERCIATALTIIVQVDDTHRRSCPLSDVARQRLRALRLRTRSDRKISPER